MHGCSRSLYTNNSRAGIVTLSPSEMAITDSPSWRMPWRCSKQPERARIDHIPMTPLADSEKAARTEIPDPNMERGSTGVPRNDLYISCGHVQSQLDRKNPSDHLTPHKTWIFHKMTDDEPAVDEPNCNGQSGRTMAAITAVGAGRMTTKAATKAMHYKFSPHRLQRKDGRDPVSHLWTPSGTDTFNQLRYLLVHTFILSAFFLQSGTSWMFAHYLGRLWKRDEWCCQTNTNKSIYPNIKLINIPTYVGQVPNFLRLKNQYYWNSSVYNHSQILYLYHRGTEAEIQQLSPIRFLDYSISSLICN